MARNEQDREDLIAEASALVDRVELHGTLVDDSEDRSVICGYRRTGYFSIYFGQDVHYQFDSEGCLRRAFIEPFLYRAQYGTLVQLERNRTAEQTQLLRQNLSDAESEAVILECHARLNSVVAALQDKRLSVVRAVCSGQTRTEQDLLQRIQATLSRVLRRKNEWFSRTIKGRRFRET